MQVSVESTGALERRLTVQVPADRIEKQIEERLQSLSRRAKIKGFRPGKVPYKVVRQHYGDDVRQEVLSEVMRSSFSEAVTEQQLNPAGMPRIEPQSAEPGQDLRYTATIEVYPEIKLTGLDGIEVERPQVEITDADLDAMLERMRKQHATWEEVQRPAAQGDRVNVDFEGTIGGEPFPGNKGENTAVELGSGNMLPEFEKALEGAEPGQELSFDVTFPDDYHGEDVAGKTARFQVTVRSVSEPRLPELDEEFAKTFGVTEGGVEKLRERLRESMQREAEQTARNRVKQQVLDGLAEANPVEVPTALVDEEIERLRKDTAARMGVPEERTADLPRELFAEQAEKRVRLGLLIGELIREQEIEADRDRLKETVDGMVAGYENPEEMAHAYMQNPQVLRSLEAMVLEEQVVDHLLGRAKVSDKPVSFDELVNQAE